MNDHGTTIVRGLTLVEALDTRRNEVWRAVATGDDGDQAATVAVKLLHPAYEPIVPKRFGRRGRALSRLVDSGTNWVPLLDHGYTTDGRRYLVAPLHRGSLADQLEHGPTPWYPAAGLIAEASFTVSEAHAAGYSFGYLRPSGILVDGPSAVHVVAYGMSTRRFDDGTAQFMAPELTDDGRPIPPSDVYSLALILASLIAGRPIDHGEARSEVVDEVAGDAPGRIVEIIEYGLSTGLRNRYADAGKFARTLEAALQEPRNAARRRPSTQLPDTVDPLAVLSADPLVGVVAQPNGDDGSRHDAGVDAGLPDRRDPRHPDETPTAVPFDAPVDTPPIDIDDPTDPGIAVGGEPDTETDHFGPPAHLGDRATIDDRPTAGPLADLLTVVDPRPKDSSRTDTSTPDGQPNLERGIEHLDTDDQQDRSNTM